MAFRKDPDDILDYTVDAEAWLAPVSDSIASVVWLSSDGITVGDAAPHLPTNTNTTATAWLFGGVLDAEEFATCRITTHGGRTKDFTVRLEIIEN